MTTHVHPEHDLGASAFPASTKLIRSQDQIRDIDEFGLQTAKSFASRTPLMAQLLEGAELPQGRHHVRQGAPARPRRRPRADHRGRRHRTRAGDTAIFVEDDNVLFAGDVVMQSFPAFASPDARVGAWLAALDRLEALKPARIVPSHGPMGDLSMLRAWREYFTDAAGARLAS